MPSKSKVYIVGVGYSSSPGVSSPARDVSKSLVSAAVKALLDAGVTFDDISQGVTSTGSKPSSDGSEVFKTFGGGDIPVDDVSQGSELDGAAQLIRMRGSQCVLLITVEKSTAVALVLASDNFLQSHPYLKDSAALIRQLDAPQSDSEKSGRDRLYDVCQMVWMLRGWSDASDNARQKEYLSYRGASNQKFELSRADSRAIPDWKDVEHKQDGKHRLGYNPATETRDISQEDFEAVRAVGKRRNEAEDRIQFQRNGGDRAALSKL